LPKAVAVFAPLAEALPANAEPMPVARLAELAPYKLAALIP
jgi:hypothetical protein